MNKIVIVLVAVLTVFGLQAQNPDTTKIKIGGKKIIIIDQEEGGIEINMDTTDTDVDIDLDGAIQKSEKDDEKKELEFDPHWAGLELNVNWLMNSDFELPGSGFNHELDLGRSWGFSLNLLEGEIFNIRDRFGLYSGLGFDWQYYQFANDYRLENNEELGTVFNVLDQPEYDKNRLHVAYITAPLMFEYQIPVGKKKKDLYFAFGGKIGYKLGSNMLYEYSDGDVDVEMKEKNDFNLTDFQYGVSVRAGYRFIKLFANYDFSPLFKEDKGPELYPFELGIVLLDF